MHVKKKKVTIVVKFCFQWYAVLRASGLTPKDAYGSLLYIHTINNNYSIIIVRTGLTQTLCNPYCRLGILNGVQFESLTVKQKDLEVWRKEGLVEGVVSTKVKQATLEPEWNEDFHLWVNMIVSIDSSFSTCIITYMGQN